MRSRVLATITVLCLLPTSLGCVPRVSRFDDSHLGMSTGQVQALCGKPDRQFATADEACEFVHKQLRGFGERKYYGVPVSVDVGPKSPAEVAHIKLMIKDANNGKRPQEWWVYDDRGKWSFFSTLIIAGFLDDKLVLTAHPRSDAGIEFDGFLRSSVDK